MSLPKITPRDLRVIGTEDGPIQSDFHGAVYVRRFTYEDGTSALFLRDVRIVDLEYGCSILQYVGPSSYVYFLIGENGVHYSIQVDYGGARWLGQSFPQRIQR